MVQVLNSKMTIDNDYIMLINHLRAIVVMIVMFVEKTGLAELQILVSMNQTQLIVEIVMHVKNVVQTLTIMQFV